MKKLTMKALPATVSAMMMWMGVGALQSASASDIDIYKSAATDSGVITLMLMLDISGSMNVSYSSRYDYNLGSGNGPQEGNVYRTIDTPILDALAQLPANRPPNNTRRMRHPASQMYEKAWFDQVLASGDLGGFTLTQVRNEWNTYVAYSPRSYCQNSAMARFREAGWQPTLITETNADGRGYQRTYCRLPVDATTIDSKYWINSTVGASWIMDPVIGCPTYDTNGDGTPDERRCYARISRLKDALWDVINGNPDKGIEPLSDDIVLGMSTLGLHLNSYNGSEPNRPLWDPDNPDRVRSGSHARELGAVRVPARPLGEIVNGRTQRQILLDFIRNERLFGAHTNTPTARSFAETVSYMLGTSTLPSQELREIGLRNWNTWAYRSCVAWDNTRYLSGTGVLKIRPCVEWGFSDGRPVNNGGNGWWVDSYDVDYFEPNTRFFGAHPTIAGRDALLGMPRGDGTRIIIGYGESSPSGFPFSAKDSKKANGLEYEPPASLVGQKYPECNGQGVYVLSDGTPTVHNHEEAQMKLALGSYGNSFTCGEDEWDCMSNLSEAILDPARNPMGLKYKTAVVGFAKEYTDSRFTPYNPSASIAENLAGVPDSDTSTMARFARWGIRGQGGWYAGSSSQSVVDSINSFIATLSADIPESVTGQPTVPVDPLNPLTLMNHALYGSFVPQPGQYRRFWRGDMNKYIVRNQMLYGGDNQTPLFNTDGDINHNVLGQWDAGMRSKLPLRGVVNNKHRMVFTNMTGNANAKLDAVNLDVLYGAVAPATAETVALTNALAADRNAWLNILGYEVDVNADTPRNALPATKELRQLGAVLHSRPIVLTQEGKITRGTTGLNVTDRKDYVLFGSTQGMLHVVDSATGEEKIAFVPKEMMTRQKNNFQNQSLSTATGAMAYGIDGQWTAYTQYLPMTGGGFTVNGTAPSSSADVGGKALQWVYGGLRMGGRSYYGLDLSDIGNPKLKFHINPDGVAAGSALAKMGQSWSKPTLGFVNWNGQRRLVMFVGGGYDDGYENPTYEQSNNVGAGVYMFDAHDGKLLWWGSAEPASYTDGEKHTDNDHLKYSVVSQIATYDRNGDGLVDNLLFGDLGGQLFRVDIDNAQNDSNELFTRIVRLHSEHQAGGLSPRFYERPSLSAHSQDGVKGQFAVVSIASGNRSSPLAEGADKSARDALFVIYDHDILNRNIVKKTTVPSVSETRSADPLPEHIDTNTQEYKAVNANGVKQRGWKYYLSSTPGKFKGYGAPRVVDNFLTVATYTPDGGTVEQSSCNAGIVGESYQSTFCLPGAVCNEKQKKVLQITALDKAGTPISTGVGVGIVEAAVGLADAADTYGSLNPKAVDCNDSKNFGHPNCLKEVSSITNKPVRWYEYNPRS